ncbi:hypothetical protein QIS99_30580 [Streptomyces sp. B-S-A8]|uniref:Uncharacterized protein n=1 Tax=Streptomyces solicavernae TaxID=3043614 RepID=A0ABT6S1H4_9ACTN|nr:hypothetical protein [Streptomyces sp. B-S-A8]MDI3390508.1 hypothetical protein [Streptomyces sp. B-S-A8]
MGDEMPPGPEVPPPLGVLLPPGLPEEGLPPLPVLPGEGESGEGESKSGSVGPSARGVGVGVLLGPGLLLPPESVLGPSPTEGVDGLSPPMSAETVLLTLGPELVEEFEFEFDAFEDELESDDEELDEFDELEDESDPDPDPDDSDPLPESENLSPFPFARLLSASLPCVDALLRIPLPALPARLSRRLSPNVCGVCWIASQPASLPALTVSPRLRPSWAPKPTFTDWRTRSVIIASTAETTGSFMHSMTASSKAFASSLRSRRTTSRVTAVAARLAMLDRPKVTTDAAAAAMIWAARATSWTMTAILHMTTSIAALRSVVAMMPAAWQAFWR